MCNKPSRGFPGTIYSSFLLHRDIHISYSIYDLRNPGTVQNYASIWDSSIPYQSYYKDKQVGCDRDFFFAVRFHGLKV